MSARNFSIDKERKGKDRALRRSPERLPPGAFSFFRRVVLGSLIVRTDRTKLVSRVEDTGDSNSVVLKRPALSAGRFIRSFV